MLEPRLPTRSRRSGRPTTNEREWVGGRLLPPMFVTGGEPRRVELIVWLELPDDLVVGHEVIDPSSPVSFAETLERALKQPMVGSPRRPERVRVADEAVAGELRAAIPDLEVVVAPTPELDAFLDLMTRTMPRGDERESYFEGGRVPPEAVAELFRASELLWRVAPWKVAYDAQVIRVDVPELGVEGACLSILGKAGESFGLLLFPSVEGYDAFGAAMERSSGGRIELGTTVLSLSFDRGPDLPASMRREAAAQRWPVASPEAYPRVEHRDRDGVPKPLVERDVRLMTAIATSFGAFFAKHRELFAKDEPEPFCESYYDEDDLEVRFTVPYEAAELFAANDHAPTKADPKVGRNAPCPCGSGKKYKKCCLAKDEAGARPDVGAGARAHVHESDERLVATMRRWARERFGRAWLRAADDFADAEVSKQLALPWSVYQFAVEGRPIVDHFLETHPHLPAAERAWLEAQQRSWLGVWEVAAVERGRSVTAKDLLSGEERRVHEVSGSRTLSLRDAVLARVIDHDGLSVLCGCHPQPLEPGDAAEVVRRVRAKLRKKAAPIPAERLREDEVGRYLIKRWEEASALVELRALIPPELQNTDGDPLLMTTDHFLFARDARAEIVERLGTLEGAQPPDEDDPDCFTFLKEGNAIHKTWETTVMGRAIIGDGGLKLETNSVKRADALRLRVEAAVGDRIRHRAREHSDPIALAARKEPGSRTQAPEQEMPPEAIEFIRQMKARHFADWIDHPIPALGGKTPRDAARTKAGRARVDVLLKDMENHESRVDDGTAFDFLEIRRALKLDP